MCNICVRIANPMRVSRTGYPIGEWVELPVSQEELLEVLDEIEVTDDDYFISDSNTENFDIPIDQFTSLSELNALVERINEVDEDDYFKLAALIEMEEPTDFAAVYAIIDKLDEYDFLSEIQDDYALGRYFAIDCDMLYGTPENMKYFFDFREFGFCMRLKYEIQYTSLGAIYRK